MSRMQSRNKTEREEEGVQTTSSLDHNGKCKINCRKNSITPLYPAVTLYGQRLQIES